MKKYFTVEEHIQAFEDSKQRGLALLTKAGINYFNSKPDASTWSVAEILDHLNFIDGLYIDIFQNKLDQSDSLPAGNNQFKHRLWVRLVCKFFEPPYKIKFNVPGDNEPASDRSFEEVKTQYRQTREQLIRIANNHKSLALDEIRIASPLSDKLKLSVSEAFSFLACHQRRHLWQAGNVLEIVTM